MKNLNPGNFMQLKGSGQYPCDGRNCLRPLTNIQRENILYIYTPKLYVLSFF